MIRSAMNALFAALATLVFVTPGAVRAVCVGDCDANGTVKISEVQRCANIFLGLQPLTNCSNCDRNGDGQVKISEVQAAANSFLNPATCPMVTPSGASPTPAVTNTPANTPVPTNTPTSTPIPPTSTATQTATVVGTPAAECGAVVGLAPSKCCNGVVDPGELCDNGGTCVGGANNSMPCTGNSGCPGGSCVAFGGDGCAANCTPETTIHFEFTGAQCFGGVKNGQVCNFVKSCVGGPFPGKPCSVNVNCNLSGGSGGVCTNECGTDSDCFGVGFCSAGDANLLNTTCASSPKSNFPPAVVKLCKGGTKNGSPCTLDTQCPGAGAKCVNPCSPTSITGICTHQTGAALQTLTFLGALAIGPLVGGNDMHVGQALASDPNKIVPVAIPGASVIFAPVRVPTLACACPHGVAMPNIHGPGNSGSGFIGCGSNGLTNANVDISFDHNTTPNHLCLNGAHPGMTCTANADCGSKCTSGPNIGTEACTGDKDCGKCTTGPTIGAACATDTDCGGGANSCGKGFCDLGICNLNNGPGACSAGARNGLACGADSDCPGASCTGRGNGGGICIGGTNNLKPCKAPSDCPGANAICNSPDDSTCSTADPIPPAGSGDKACREAKVKCFGGTLNGQPCARDADCGGNPNSCGTDCPGGLAQQLSLHPGVCNSPRHLTLSGGTSVPGTGLVVTSTAIGVIATPADSGNCAKSAICLPATLGAAVTNCLVDSECSSCSGGPTPGKQCAVAADCGSGGTCAPHPCGTALCGGLCTGGTVAGKGCLTDGECGTGGTCAGGANFGTACTGTVANECGGSNVCVPVNLAKGFDGLPCTADDPASSQGVAATIPTTTGTATAGAVDTNNGGLLEIGGQCTGFTNCATSAKGIPFNCTNLLAATPSVKGARTAASFPQVEGNTTGDSIVTNLLSAK